MLPEPIDSIDDPRVEAYRNLRDRTLRGESLFVTEGRVLTLRLLRSRYEAESVFVAEPYLEEVLAVVQDRAPVYVAPERLLLDVVGFNFHRGVLAAGRRPPMPLLEDVLPPPGRPGPLRLVVCPEITKPENMGLIFRTAGALGIDAVLLGERSCDPFSRRSLRVSMGAVLVVPFRKSTDLASDLLRLRQSWNVELLATVLDPSAERLPQVSWPQRAGLLFGNESEGLRAEWLQIADRHVTLPMAPGVDSLNLGVAAGIFLYEMTRTTGAGGGCQAIGQP